MPFINIDSGLGFAAGILVTRYGVPWVVAKVQAAIAAGKADVAKVESDVRGILPKTVAELKALEATIAKKL